MSLRALRSFVLTMALIASAATGAFGQRVTNLAGDWKYLPYNGEGDMASATIDDSAWPAMQLPSNWFLLGSKEYPSRAQARVGQLAETISPGTLTTFDPEKGFDYGGTVWYRRSVEWKKTAGKRAILDLDMVDYYADVFVNGKKLGSHEGYFQKWSVDVTDGLRDGQNLIAIKVSAPLLPFDMAQHFPLSWPKAQNQVKGIFGYHDTRPGATSAHGQERSTGGILRGIELRESSGVDIVSVRVLPVQVSDKTATLRVETTIRNWTKAARNVAVNGEISAANFTSAAHIPYTASTVAKPGLTQVVSTVEVADPVLWWSWDYGKPNLYQFHATLNSGRLALAEAKVRFGIRSVTIDKDWVWHLNGKRIYARGSNYIATQWLSQADRAWYERDVRLMIESNLNSIRVHAHLERPEFYEVADEMGVLVWQDFPLQWGYTDSPEFHAEALRQAGDMVTRFANYPSIVLWCMHNESPYAMDWMQKRDPKQNLELDNKLVALAAKLDPSRIAHRDSGTGDGHTYPGWYEGSIGDFGRRVFREKLMTEYGAQALPNLETLRQMFDESVLFPRTGRDFETWKLADFQPSETFDRAGVQQGSQIEEFIRNSQTYQAQLVRFATENFRRGKYTRSTGIYHFMFTEDWPSITWAVVDYYRRPKLGFTALKESMQPVLPSIEYQIDDPEKPITIHVVNDSYRDLAQARVCWTIGNTAPACKTAGVGPDSVGKVAELGVLREVTSGTARLQVWIELEGQVLGRNSLAAEDFVTRRQNRNTAAVQ